ncbi:hypothetical protein GGS21DRAFT_493072 [Xylaria nigripes]|nr:hypothetical protein GGS21DRAFT_493072 [Xylaria nigripes]
MNNTYFNISRDGGEMIESPILPTLTGRPRFNTVPMTAASARSESETGGASRSPMARNTYMLPQPLFSSARLGPAENQTMTPVSPVTTYTTTTMTESATASPTLSNFPMPPTMADTPQKLVSMQTAPRNPALSPLAMQLPMAESPQNTVPPFLTRTPPRTPTFNIQHAMPEGHQNTVPPLCLQTHLQSPAASVPRPASSIYSQHTTANMRPPRTASPTRPASSIYSQSTVTMVSEPPRSPTMTDWASTLPGLPNSHAYAPPTRMECVKEEPPQIQVPRLRTPSLPQDRGRKTSLAGSVVFVPSPEPVLSREPTAAAEHGDAQCWPVLQKPSATHNAPETRHYVHRSRGSGSGSVLSHDARGPSAAAGSSAPRAEEGSPRNSMVDAHTPIFEQRSGWWSDDDDDEEVEDVEARAANRVALATKAKKAVQKKKNRTLLIIGAVLVVAAVVAAIGVGFGLRKG